jgi:hypothetical protein
MIKNVVVAALALFSLACGGSSGPSTPAEFCSQSESILCDKVFQCVPTSAQDQSFIDTFGTSVSDCKMNKVPADCATATCTTFNASDAQTCINKLGPLTCADVGDMNTPPECDTACP